MIKAVLDTNVLVSALLSPGGKPARILALVLNERITLCYDSRILLEYEDVLTRSKFPFEPRDVSGLLSIFEQIGTAIAAEPATESFTDESDKKFYEVAKTAGAILITGNNKHFPDDPYVLSPLEFLKHRLNAE
jgi:putative PIN family toxin of toxin-antitoxin system